MRHQKTETWGIDVDGVLADFNAVYHAKACEILGRALPPCSFSDWDMGVSLNLQPMEAAMIESAMKSPGVCSSLPAIPLAIEGLGALAERVNVIFVTAPYQGSPTWQYEREEWLVKHFGPCLGRQVIHTRHKAYVAVDVLLDDRAETLVKWVKRYRKHAGRMAMCWAYPHNEGVADLCAGPPLKDPLANYTHPSEYYDDAPDDVDRPVVVRTNSWQVALSHANRRASNKVLEKA